MLKKRVCICLLFNDGVLFRTKKFVPDYRYSQSFLGVSHVDEVFMIDITRSGPSDLSHESMAAYAEKCFVPITMGGHIKSLDDVARFMAIGADKVVVGRELHVSDTLASEIVTKYGSQALVAAVDAQGAEWVRSGSLRPWNYSPAFCAQAREQDGAGEIFLQSVQRDGSLSGYDLDTLRAVVDAVSIPVVVGTSCGTPRHMREAFEAGASGCATANIFHMSEASMRGFKSQLQEYVRP